MFSKRFIPMVLISCLLTSYMPLSANSSVGNSSVGNSSVGNSSVGNSSIGTTSINTVSKGNTPEGTTSMGTTSVGNTPEGNTSMGTSSIDIPATGEITVTSVSNKEPTQADLERIITAVKSKIKIPTQLSQFDYNFSAESSYSSAIWNLNWSNADNTKQINVQSDQNGNILYYYSNNSNGGNYVPKYLKLELKAEAKQFIKKIAPDIFGSIEYVRAESQGTNSGQYLYQFQRVENGIPMPDNMITVGVNFETGNVVSYSASWLYDVKIPSAEVKVTEKEATEKIGKKVTMKLAYQNAYTTDKDGNTTVKAFLVYSPDQTYIAVDAKTGEVYTTQNEWIEKTSNSTAVNAETASKDTAGFTQEEILKVEELAGLISREEAIKSVTDNKSLLLDKNLKSISAKLYKQDDTFSVGEKTKYVWNINLSDPREIVNDSGDTYRAYASATVDAQTGKLISYNSSVKDYYNMSKAEWETVKVKFSSEQGQKVLEDFLKLQIPDLLKNSVLTDNKESYVIAYKDEKEVYGGYYYQYERVNEGINYSYNNIYGAVDGVTGKIYSYSYNWSENVKFESPKGIITAKQAFDSYISKDGFDLAYEINNIHTIDSTYATKEAYYDSSDAYSVNNEIRLVYRTDISPAYISPFTGKQLNYDGEEYSADENTYSYADIEGNDSARNIKLLADIGIGFSGEKFLPEQAITTKELGEFLSLANYYYDTTKYKLKNDSSTVTRLVASKFIVQIMGYESIAKLKGIYNTAFKDQKQISDAYLGYVALAQGLNLITSDSNNKFNPNLKLTRAEAADVLIAMLSVEK